MRRRNIRIRWISEFAVNIASDGSFMVNLCNLPAAQVDSAKSVAMPVCEDSQVVFDLRDTAMGQSRKEKIDIVVLVDPQKYYTFPHARKYEPAKIISNINQSYGSQNKNMMLIVPGRIGTSSPELGVPVVYADINLGSGRCVKCLIVFAGYMPELSYGSHMFQDLVEAHIFYGAIFEDERTRLYQPELLDEFDTESYLDGMIRVFDVSERGARLYFDMLKGMFVV